MSILAKPFARETPMILSLSAITRWAGRDKSRAALTVALLALQLAGAPDVEAATFTVTRSDDQLDTNPGDGLCVAQNGGGCSLRAAVQEANALFGSDGIWLPPGTYSLTRAGANEGLAVTGDLDVTSPITLLGTGWDVTTVAMGSFDDRLFEVQGFSTLILGDLTLEGGSVAGVGGGIFVGTGAALELSRSRIRGCFAHHGGGIGTLGGAVTIQDAEIAYNYAVDDAPTWYGRGLPSPAIHKAPSSSGAQACTTTDSPVGYGASRSGTVRCRSRAPRSSMKACSPTPSTPRTARWRSSPRP